MSESTAIAAHADAPATVARDDYRPLVRMIDLVCGGLQGIGLPLGRLDPGSILDAARSRTGLKDWGKEDFLVPMDRILAEARGAPFSSLARCVVRQTFIAAVSNRLRIEDWYRRNPAASQERIERPVFILGFPRTGTTLLQNLLSLDPGARALRFWELQSPVPVHADPAVDRHRRLRTARATLQAAYFVAPEMEFVHEIGPETAEECWPLFANTFAVLNWDIAGGLRGYGQWLLGQDMCGPYAEYRRQLQMMAHHQPTRRFVLKCPEHLWFIDALLDVFPDASIVWTHRDPVDSVASYCSLISLNRRMLYGHIDHPAIGAHIEQSFAQGVDLAMQARARHPHARFYDVSFRALVKDPKVVVRQLKDALDIEHAPDQDARIDAWLENERKDKRGAHHYDAARFGLEPGRVYQRFADYIDRYQIPLKHR